MFVFEDDPEIPEDRVLNQALFGDVFNYLAENSLVLEDSEGMLWVEADQTDDSILEEILELLPAESRFSFSCTTYPDTTFDINLSRGDVSFNIDYDAEDAYDEQFGYLFATIKGAQNIVPEYSFRWWVGLERLNELEDGVRPMIILSQDQWNELLQAFGEKRLSEEFQPVV